jgi:hypothetical protein
VERSQGTINAIQTRHVEYKEAKELLSLVPLSCTALSSL